MANNFKLGFPADFMKTHADKFSQIANSARGVHEVYEQEQKRFDTINNILEEVAEENQVYRDWQLAGVQANIESRDHLLEQNALLRKQLAEQTEINQRLEREFAMGAREAVITRKIAYWSLGIGIAGVVVALIALFKR